MKWQDWIAPAIVVAMVGIGMTFINSRFSSLEAQYADVGKRLTDIDAKLDRRVDGLTGRFDAILQQQTTLASQLGSAQGELAYIRSRLDKVAEKLQVTSIQEPGQSPIRQPNPAYGNNPGSSVPTGGGKDTGGFAPMPSR